MINTKYILIVDSSDMSCSLALVSVHGSVVAVKQKANEKKQAQTILPMYRELLGQVEIVSSDLTAIAVCSGPGSFTGLRISLSFVQGLAYSLRIPVVQLSSLHALALTAVGQCDSCKTNIEEVFVCVDARMNEYYCAAFAIERGQLHRTLQDSLFSIAQLEEVTKDRAYSDSLLWLGSGVGALELGHSAHCLDTALQINVESLAQYAANQVSSSRYTELFSLEPFYVRREDAWKSLEQQKNCRALEKND